MEKMYFAKAWLLSQILFDTEHAAKSASELVADGQVSLGYVLALPYILMEELQQLGKKLGRDWQADVEAFKDVDIENFIKTIA